MRCYGYINVDLMNFTGKGKRYETYKEGNYIILNYNPPQWLDLEFKWGPQEQQTPTMDSKKILEKLLGFGGPIVAIANSIASHFVKFDSEGAIHIGTKNDFLTDKEF